MAIYIGGLHPRASATKETPFDYFIVVPLYPTYNLKKPSVQPYKKQVFVKTIFWGYKIIPGYVIFN